MTQVNMKPQKAKLLAPVVPVVGDAGIAAPGLAFGKIVPLVIVDDSKCPGLSEVIRVHEHIEEGGDVTTQWATQTNILKKTKIILIVEFIRPVKLSCLILFDLSKHALIIDQIIKVSKLHVMTGKSGDRYIQNMDRPKIHLDVPETGFFPAWDKIYRDEAFRRFKKGCSAKEAHRRVEIFMAQRAEMVEFSVEGLPGKRKL